MEYNVRVFGKVIKGIHPSELPKFAAHISTQEYWKNYNGYANKPVICSARSAKPVEHEFHLPNKTNREVAKKVTELKILTEESPTNTQTYLISKKRVKSRWTRQVEMFMPEARHGEAVADAAIAKEEPLFSSFSKDNLFADPLANLKR
eukprot:TRINITY_DN10520_c0_g4_i1.p1 TRINITY_DN10520_c0_g4~~TRINITY_DN10520_c0_g4_i1.p1  ORF type:complete len:148 (-),score=16.63 TRINITY_DN10520_c0_g4_i1:83-526(-)